MSLSLVRLGHRQERVLVRPRLGAGMVRVPLSANVGYGLLVAESSVARGAGSRRKKVARGEDIGIGIDEGRRGRGVTDVRGGEGADEVARGRGEG